VIRRGNLDGRRQVEDDRSLLRPVLAVKPRVRDGRANLDRERLLGLRERLGRVLVLPLGSVAALDRLAHELAHDRRVPRRELDCRRLVVAEDDLAEAWRGRVVLRGQRGSQSVAADHVQDDTLRPAHRVERPTDQVLARRRQDLQPDALGLAALRLDDAAHERKVRVAGRRVYAMSCIA